MSENKNRGMIHVKVLLPDGDKKIFLLSKKIANALDWDYKNGDRSGFRKLRGCYITVPISQYNDKRQAKMTTGRILSVFWKHRWIGTLFTRSQFVTEEHLEQSLIECYQYLRHDYTVISRVRIFFSLAHWKKANAKKKKLRGCYACSC